MDQKVVQSFSLSMLRRLGATPPRNDPTVFPVEIRVDTVRYGSFLSCLRILRLCRYQCENKDSGSDAAVETGYISDKGFGKNFLD